MLTEVGDDKVLQQLEGGPDILHGPHSSSSMMAGSVMDSIDHSDPLGERVTVSPNASQSKPDRRQEAGPRPARSRVARQPRMPAASPAKARALPAIAGALSAPRGGQADRLILIKGIGPVNEKKLNDHGIFHFDQIAAWTRGRRRGRGSLSRIRRPHRARRLDRTGEGACQTCGGCADRPQSAGVNDGVRKGPAQRRGRRDVLRQHPRAERRQRVGRGRRDRCADRRQRRRQVDADDDHLRQPARPQRHDPFCRRRHHADCRRTRSPACGSRNRPKAAASFRA